MSFDALKNFAASTVATPPSPATSGTSLVVVTGHGARFPAVPFNATVWPVNFQPDDDNAEIVRVTNITGDTLTITRHQESTSARAIVIGDLIAATITAKVLTDIEATVCMPKFIVFLDDTIANIPTLWSEATAIRGRTVVGMPASGTKGGTVGSALTNLLDRTHTHTYDTIAHVHSVPWVGTPGSNSNGLAANMTIGGYNDTGSTGSGSGITSTAATSNTMPYIQYPAIEMT
jgi:hypothetical protein